MATKQEVAELLDTLQEVYEYRGGNPSALLRAWFIDLEDVDPELFDPALKHLRRTFQYPWPKSSDFTRSIDYARRERDNDPAYVAKQNAGNYWGGITRLAQVLSGALPAGEWYDTRHGLTGRPGPVATEYDNMTPAELEAAADEKARGAEIDPRWSHLVEGVRS